MSQAKHTLPNRRTLITALAAAPVAIAAPAAALAPNPDAALLALEPEIERLVAAYDVAYDAFKPIEAAYFAKRLDNPAKHVEGETAAEAQIREVREWRERNAVARQVADELGLEEARERMEAADNAVLNALGPVEEIPARTLEGLMFKARMAQHDESLASVIVADLMAMQSAGGEA